MQKKEGERAREVTGYGIAAKQKYSKILAERGKHRERVKLTVFAIRFG